VSNWIPGRVIPTHAPGETLTCEDMAKVMPDDWASIQAYALRYCRKIDGTRSRKRADGSATNRHAAYGTDDVSDDVAQDAVLIFAGILRKITKTCPVSAELDTHEPIAWLYTRRNGRTDTVDRQTLRRWAVHDAAARNGYRLDMPPEETDGVPGAQLMRGVPHAENVASLAVSTGMGQLGETIFAAAWGDGTDFPTLGRVLFNAENADDLGRAGVLAKTAQDEYGGVYGSRRSVRRTRAKAEREYAELSARLDDARDQLIHAGNGR
jgi:hypothetical protein